MSEDAPTTETERAEDEAERRGCVPENPCWSECVEAAREDLVRASFRPRVDREAPGSLPT